MNGTRLIIRFGMGSLCTGFGFLFGCSDRAEEPPPRSPTAACVLQAISDIARIETNRTGVVFTRLDVSAMSASDFKARLTGAAPADIHVWMPGERDWIVVSAPKATKVSLAAVLECFASDPDSGSASEAFASYVGTAEDVLPAFASDLQGPVVPQWFVTKEIPALRWLDASDVDTDIRDRFLTEVRTCQNARRTLLKGNMLASDVRGKGEESKPIAEWSKARKLNHHDPMLQERLENLRRNAKGFLDALKIPQAMKCYETLVRIDPMDATSLYNFGQCLKRIGKTELAEGFIRRSEEIRR